MADGNLIDERGTDLPTDLDLGSASHASSRLFNGLLNGRFAAQRTVTQILRADLEG